MQFADKEYTDVLMDLTIDSPFEYTIGALTVSLGSARPLQIPIWNSPQMTSIKETVGEGWHKKIFNTILYQKINNISGE
jgi:hypothetical protein